MFGDPVQQNRALDNAKIDHHVGQRFARGFVFLVQLVELRGRDEPLLF
jgi:hypothetical protein